MSNAEKWTILTRREQPDLGERFFPQKERIWSGFMFEDVVSNKYWHRYVNELYPEFQQYLLDEKDTPQ